MPRARNRSHAAAARCARSRSSGTRFSPKLIVADFSIPPHSRHAGSSSPARTRSSVSSIGPRQPHARHLAKCTVPWISIELLGVAPGGEVQAVDVLGDERVHVRRRARARRPRGARRSAPRPRSRSAAGSATRASGPRGRRRSAASVAVFSAAGFFVHTPCGPRKSGMPDSVEMPAPVRITIARASRSQPAMVSSASVARLRRRRSPAGGYRTRRDAGSREGNGWGGAPGAEGRESPARRPTRELSRGVVGGGGRARRGGRLRRTRGGGVRAPTRRSRGRSSGGSRCRAARARRGRGRHPARTA